jgi:ribosomal protein S18 acetylase RimI-like enzyme
MSGVEPKVGFADVTEKNIELVRILNTAMFPVKYRESFYEQLLAPGRQKLSVLALYGYDIVCGAICCRVEPPKAGVDAPGSGDKLYIMTLAVLDAYQRLGIASQLVAEMLARVQKTWPTVARVYLHVQTSNERAIAFYTKLGFKVDRKLEGYYQRISPPDAFILIKDIERSATPAQPHRK